MLWHDSSAENEFELDGQRVAKVGGERIAAGKSIKRAKMAATSVALCQLC